MSYPSWEYIFIHHSASHDSPDVDLESIRDFHVEVRRWRDVGYHFVVERVDGEPQTLFARSALETGAHCPSWNTKALGVCIVGNFSEAVPDGDLLLAAARSVASLCYLARIPVESVHRHSDHKATECPGSKFPWDRFVGMVRSCLEAR